MTTFPVDIENYKPKRPLLHRLVDIEHALKIDGQPIHALDIRQAIERIEALEKLTESVDVKVQGAGPSR